MRQKERFEPEAHLHGDVQSDLDFAGHPVLLFGRRFTKTSSSTCFLLRSVRQKERFVPDAQLHGDVQFDIDFAGHPVFSLVFCLLAGEPVPVVLRLADLFAVRLFFVGGEPARTADFFALRLCDEMCESLARASARRFDKLVFNCLLLKDFCRRAAAAFRVFVRPGPPS